MDRRSGLSKLTRPRLYRALPRERLFRQLDEARERPVTWICSPPGAGKTTLVSSYLEARACPVAWYHMDNGDADPASFFFYLSEAAALAAPQTHAPLPLLAPEYLTDLSGFTRRFFRDFYARLPRPGALVFDNYHEVPAASVLHRVFRDALEEVPEGVHVIVTSRGEPPAELTRLRLSRRLARIDWDGLRLSFDEARQIAVLEGRGPQIDETQTRALWERSGGWAAGLVLILEHGRASDAQTPAFAPPSREALFQYFASEIFAMTPPETRHLLLRTAFLPSFTVAMAEAISGDLDAGKRLEALFRLGHFIDRRDEAGLHYQYHALFREFLLARCRDSLEPTEQQLLARRSARLLELDGRPEDAFPLYRDSGDWAAATRMILQTAQSWIDQGRWQSVKRWIDALPAAVVQGEPQLAYWLGACELSVNPASARRSMELAYTGFEAAGDALGQIAAAAAIIETYYFEWTNFAPLDRWIEAMGTLLDAAPRFASPADELRARSSLLAAALYRQPQHPRLSHEPDRVLALMQLDVPAARQFTAGTILVNYYCFLGRFDDAARVVGLLQARLPDPSVPPINEVWWNIALAYHRMQCADAAGAEQTLDRAQCIAHDHGLRFIEPALLTQQTLVALTFGDLERAGALVPRLQASIHAARRMDVALLHLTRSWLELQQGNLAAAARHGQTAVDVSFETGAITIQTYCLMAKAQLLAECGEHAEALSCARGVRTRAASLRSSLLEFHTLLIEADAALRSGHDAQGVQLLRAGLAIGRREGYLNTFRWLPRMMSRLLGRALDADIETDYATALIRARRLLPEPGCSERWPWPIRIHALGRFGVAVDGEPLTAAGKARSKPLELLKALVAFGGREVSGSSLTACLWPDADGDAADNALDVTVHRLRKVLAHDAALVVSQGRLSLNAQLVWTDVWAFERLAEQSEARAGELLRLYQGDFLERDGDVPWALPMRERLRSKFLRRLLLAGSALEAAADWDGADELYRRGLEIDSLSEELYRRLMTCQQQRGHLAEAMQTYRRCRQMLSVVLGLQPSPRTEALYRRLGQGSPD